MSMQHKQKYQKQKCEQFFGIALHCNSNDCISDFISCTFKCSACHVHIFIVWILACLPAQKYSIKMKVFLNWIRLKDSCTFVQVRCLKVHKDNIDVLPQSYGTELDQFLKPTHHPLL